MISVQLKRSVGNTNCPLASVSVALSVPDKVMVAPMTGSLFSFVNRPRTGLGVMNTILLLVSQLNGWFIKPSFMIVSSDALVTDTFTFFMALYQSISLKV